MPNKTGASGGKWPSQAPAKPCMALGTVEPDGVQAFAVGRTQVGVAVIHKHAFAAMRG